MFGSLLERPLIAADAYEKYPLLIRMYDRELDCCKLLFRKQTQMAEKMGEIEHSVPRRTLIYYTYLRGGWGGRWEVGIQGKTEKSKAFLCRVTRSIES